MADLSLLKLFFKSYFATLQETSCDKENKVFLCQSQEEVVNFDKYMQDKKEKGKKSFDALHWKDDTIYCVEFKYQKYGKIDKEKIRRKYIDGLTELGEIFRDKNLRIRDYVFKLFVIFENPSSKGAMASYRTRFKGEEIDFGFKTQVFLNNFKDVNVDIENKLKSKCGCVKDFKQEYQEAFSYPSYCEVLQ